MSYNSMDTNSNGVILPIFSQREKDHTGGRVSLLMRIRSRQWVIINLNGCLLLCSMGNLTYDVDHTDGIN